MMCPRLRCASRGLFLVLHQNCRVSCLAACAPETPTASTTPQASSRQVMFRDVDLDKAHQVPVPQVVQGLQATESNRNEHVEQESQIPSLVKDKSVDTLKLNARACTAYLRLCIFAFLCSPTRS